MIWLLIVVALVVAFGFVLLFGAPYLPTLTPQVDAALKLAALKPGQTLIELGCGDGKVVLAAARQGVKVVGYELNPVLFAVAWLRTRRYRGLVTLRCGDFWRAEWPPADAIFTFLLPKYMARLDTKVAQFQATTGRSMKLISFAFTVPGKEPAAERAGVFRYDYGSVAKP